jgi:uncharacterized protein YjlB
LSETINPESHVETVLLEPNGSFPNNPSLPVLVYRGALRDPEPGSVEQVLHGNSWRGSWRDGVYGFHHFHSNAHEVLACCAGSVRIRLGGPDGPVLKVCTGDVVIQPAGTGHRNEWASGDLLIVGAYPEGQEGYDMMRGDPGEAEAAAARIARVPVPGSDPIYGPGGPLQEHWGRPSD